MEIKNKTNNLIGSGVFSFGGGGVRWHRKCHEVAITIDFSNRK